MSCCRLFETIIGWVGLWPWGKSGGNRYATSYHLNFMTVPKELRIRKEAGEPTYLMLRKTGLPNDKELRGNKFIEVISIR